MMLKRKNLKKNQVFHKLKKKQLLKWLRKQHLPLRNKKKKKKKKKNDKKENEDEEDDENAAVDCDLLFIMDCTGSMSSYINMCRT